MPQVLSVCIHLIGKVDRVPRTETHVTADGWLVCDDCCYGHLTSQDLAAERSMRDRDQRESF